MSSIAKIKTSDNVIHNINPIKITQYTGSSNEYTISSMNPNEYYRILDVKKLTITAFASGDSGFCSNYMLEIRFKGGNTLSLPTGITWANGTAPTFVSGGVYQISIINNLGVFTKFN